MVDHVKEFDLVMISDTDEPEEAIMAGMTHTEYDGVLLVLVADGEPGEDGWYDTPEMNGRPTRPVLLFHRGCHDASQEGLEHATQTLGVAADEVSVVEEWLQDRSPVTAERRRTLEVHMSCPPYPWFEAAVIGLQQGVRYTTLELVDWTEPEDNRPATYTYDFLEAASGRWNNE